MNCTFADAVRRAAAWNSDQWEYEFGKARQWDTASTNVYMEVRRSALGPGFADSVLWGMREDEKRHYGRSIAAQIAERVRWDL